MEQLGFSELPRGGPSAHFSQLLGKKKTGWPMGPGASQGPLEGPSSQKHDTFLWLLLADCVSCHQQLAWLD